jgi:fructosamine-3-kinase
LWQARFVVSHKPFFFTTRGERLMGLLEDVLRVIEQATGAPARLAGRQGAGGGCINDAQVLELADGRRFFLKSNAASPPGMFAREAEGLTALGAVGAIRVPAVIGHGEGSAPGGATAFLVLENIETGRPGHGLFENFGHCMAELHRRSAQDRFGFDHDNYIGSTPQPNGWMDDWVAFWRERRLGHQLALARRRGLADAAMTRAGECLMERLVEIVGEPREPACLLHGDLWGGNYLIDARGEPVLIDPAAYWGRREADLAMTMLFGGFDAAFYRAYEEAWPLAAGSEDRLAVYKLYHLLNHLNLFGGGYYGACMAILRRFA